MTRRVYVSCGGDRTIHVSELAIDGALRPIATVPIPGTTEPSGSTPLAISPNRRFLYAALRTPPFPLTSFAIDPGTGELTPFASAPLPDSMAYIATDPTARWLFSASYPGALVAVSTDRAGWRDPRRGRPGDRHAAQGALHRSGAVGGLGVRHQPRRRRHPALALRSGPAGRKIVAHDTAQDRRRTAASSAGIRRYRLLPERARRHAGCAGRTGRRSRAAADRAAACEQRQARGGRPAPHARRCAALCQ